MVETLVGDKNLARLYIYRFLQLVTTYPDMALLEMLKSDELWESLERAVEILSVGGQDTIQGLDNWLKSYEDDEKLLTDLRIEYTYLFINAIPHVPAPPYESAYTDRGLLMGEPVSEVLRTYREAGLTMSESYDALPDHVAAELEFMFYLVRQETVASESTQQERADVWRERQRQFLSEHLLRWMPSFLERVTASARRPFYRLLGHLTKVILGSEKKYLGV